MVFHSIVFAKHQAEVLGGVFSHSQSVNSVNFQHYLLETPLQHFLHLSVKNRDLLRPFNPPYFNLLLVIVGVISRFLEILIAGTGWSCTTLQFNCSDFHLRHHLNHFHFLLPNFQRDSSGLMRRSFQFQ